MRSTFLANVDPTALRALNYAPEIEAFRRAGARQRGKTLRLGDVFERIGPAYGTVFTRFDCDPAHGEKLLDQGSMFASEPAPRMIRGDVLAKIENHRIHRWQVLLAAAGTLGENELFGRAIVADERLVGAIVGPDAMALWPRAPGSDANCYAYAFLCSSVGVRAVRSSAYGTKILRLRREFLVNLPIPLGTDDVVARVASLIRTAVEQRETYVRHTQNARDLLTRIPGYLDALEMCVQRRARCVVWDGPLPTFSAWNFAFVGEALKFLRRSWTARLGGVLRAPGFHSGNRSARVNCAPPHGVAFASQRDVFMMRRFPRRIVQPVGARELLFADDNTVLIACDGQAGEGNLLGRAELGACGLTNFAVTEHILRVPLRNESVWMFTLLSSELGRRMLLSTAVGTSIPKLRTDLVAALPVPDVDADLRTSITTAQRAAAAARVAADNAEAEAVRIIEQEVLPAWLA